MMFSMFLFYWLKIFFAFSTDVEFNINLEMHKKIFLYILLLLNDLVLHSNIILISYSNVWLFV